MRQQETRDLHCDKITTPEMGGVLQRNPEWINFKAGEAGNYKEVIQ